jgi:hypothetical protein
MMHTAVFGTDPAIGGLVNVFVQGMALFAEVTELRFIKGVVREAKFDTSDFATAKERNCEGFALLVSRARADSRNEWFGAFQRDEQRLDVIGHLE